MSKQAPLPSANKPSAGTPGKAKKPDPPEQKNAPDHEAGSRARGAGLAAAEPPPGNRGFVSGYQRVATVQAKGRLGRRDDPLEDEADRVAEQVVDAPLRQRTPRPAWSVLPQSSPGDAPAEAKGNPATGNGRGAGPSAVMPAISAKSADGGGGEIDSETSSLIESSRGGGTPIPGGVREEMESGIGHDFSNVRLHTDVKAQRAASNLNARAFTTGTDVYFGPGQLKTESRDGKKLLAHELTHVVQQGGAAKRSGTARAKHLDAPKPEIKGRVQPKRIQRVSLASITGKLVAGQVNRFLKRFGFWKDLTQALGFNPVTGRNVPQSPIKIVKLVLKPLGRFGTTLFRRLQKVKAITGVFTWFKANIRRFNLTSQRVVRTAKTAWDKFTFISSLETKKKTIKKAFAPLVRDMVRFGGAVVWKVKQLVFNGFMRLVGGNKGPIARLMKRAQPVIRNIWNNPVRFANNVFLGIKLGVQGFVRNIKTHLKKGFMEWLFGSVGRAGIIFPDKLSVKGVASVLLQVSGFTFANFKERAIRKFGAKAVAAAEKSLEFFQLLREKGPLGVWEQIQDKAQTIVDQALAGIKRIVIIELIKAGVLWIISLLNPGSAIVRVLKALVDVVFFVIRRAQQLVSFGNALLDSVTAIARGNVKLIASRVQMAFARALPVSMGLLANLVGFKPASKIQNTTQGLQKPSKTVIDSILNRMRSLFGGKKGGKGRGRRNKKDRGKPGKISLRLIRSQFKMSGKPHTLSVKKSLGRVRVLMASAKPRPISKHIDGALAKIKDPKEAKAEFPKSHSLIKSELPKFRDRAAKIEARMEKEIKRRGKVNEKAVVKKYTNILRLLGLKIHDFAAKVGLQELDFELLRDIVRKIPRPLQAKKRGMLQKHHQAFNNIARQKGWFIIVRDGKEPAHDLLAKKDNKIFAKGEPLKMKTFKLETVKEVRQMVSRSARKATDKDANLSKVAFPPPPHTATMQFLKFVLKFREPKALFDDFVEGTRPGRPPAGETSEEKAERKQREARSNAKDRTFEARRKRRKASVKRRSMERGRREFDKRLRKNLESGKGFKSAKRDAARAAVRERLEIEKDKLPLKDRQGNETDFEKEVEKRRLNERRNENRRKKRGALTNKELYNKTKLYLRNQYGYEVQGPGQDYIVKQREKFLVITPRRTYAVLGKVTAEAITGDYDLHGIYKKGNPEFIPADKAIQKELNTAMRERSGVDKDVIMHGAQDEWKLRSVQGVDPESTAYSGERKFPNKGFRKNKDQMIAYHKLLFNLDIDERYKKR